MTHFHFAILPLLLLVFTSPMTARATSALDLPPPLDQEAHLIERYWTWLKEEAGAPANFPWPSIHIEPLPRTVSMAFVFPTHEAPWHEARIVMSPRSIDRANGPDRLTVVGELAHEMVHYILVLAENGWNLDAGVLKNEVHHHCDDEFMRLTRQVGDFIWKVYHSNDAVRSIDQMVRLACWRDGHMIGRMSSN